MSVLFIGTCRVHGPARVLQDANHRAWIADHRAHAPRHLLSILRHLAGQEVYNERNVHLLSTRAFEAFLEKRNVLAQLNSCRGRWIETDRVVIEISTFKDEIAKGMIVDYFSRRDISRNSEYVDAEIRRENIEAIRAGDIETTVTDPEPVMSEIRELLGSREIIWLPHTFVSEAPEDLVSARKEIHEEVERIARKLGDKFFNPSAVAEAVGAEKMFEEDWYHFSQAGVRALAQAYLAHFLSPG